MPGFITLTARSRPPSLLPAAPLAHPFPTVPLTLCSSCPLGQRGRRSTGPMALWTGPNRCAGPSARSHHLHAAAYTGQNRQASSSSPPPAAAGPDVPRPRCPDSLRRSASPDPVSLRSRLPHAAYTTLPYMTLPYTALPYPRGLAAAAAA